MYSWPQWDDRCGVHSGGRYAAYVVYRRALYLSYYIGDVVSYGAGPKAIVVAAVDRVEDLNGGIYRRESRRPGMGRAVPAVEVEEEEEGGNVLPHRR